MTHELFVDSREIDIWVTRVCCKELSFPGLMLFGCYLPILKMYLFSIILCYACDLVCFEEMEFHINVVVKFTTTPIDAISKFSICLKSTLVNLHNFVI